MGKTGMTATKKEILANIKKSKYLALTYGQLYQILEFVENMLQALNLELSENELENLYYLSESISAHLEKKVSELKQKTE